MGYRVQIRPFLLTEGEFNGHMEYIHFHVFLNGVEVGRWSETNIGQFPDSLGKLVGRAKRIVLTLALLRSADANNRPLPVGVLKAVVARIPAVHAVYPV
jgi:hypothetical protein